jgi:hypothetical protein
MADDRGAVTAPPVEQSDRWVVPVQGMPIVRVDDAVTLTYTYRSGVVVGIAGGFTYRPAAGAEFRVDPDSDPSGWAPMLALARAEGTQVVAWRTGELDLAFEDGSAVHVDGDWRLSNPEGLSLVSPGGSAATVPAPDGGPAAGFADGGEVPGARPAAEHADRWVLPAGGRPAVSVDYAVTLTFRQRSDVLLRIEHDFWYRTPDGQEHWLHPGGDPVRLAPVLAAARREGTEVVAWQTGDLDVAFTDGSSIRVPHSTDAYEAWTLNGPGRLLIVSRPAESGLSVFSWG